MIMAAIRLTPAQYRSLRAPAAVSETPTRTKKASSQPTTPYLRRLITHVKEAYQHEPCYWSLHACHLAMPHGLVYTPDLLVQRGGARSMLEDIPRDIPLLPGQLSGIAGACKELLAFEVLGVHPLEGRGVFDPMAAVAVRFPLLTFVRMR